MDNSRLEQKVFLALLVVVSLAFGWILLPFYGAIMWGAIIALLFAPWYRWLLRWFKGRSTLAALLTLLGYPCEHADAAERISTVLHNDRQALILARSRGVARVVAGLSATGLTHGISHLATQFLQQFQSRDSNLGIKLIDVAGDEKGYIFFILGHFYQLDINGY